MKKEIRDLMYWTAVAGVLLGELLVDRSAWALKLIFFVWTAYEAHASYRSIMDRVAKMNRTLDNWPKS